MGVAIMVIVSFYFKKDDKEKSSEKKPKQNRSINSPLKIDRRKELRKRTFLSELEADFEGSIDTNFSNAFMANKMKKGCKSVYNKFSKEHNELH